MNSHRVLCYSPYNAWELHGQYEITILHALRLRGNEIKHVLCNGVFKACDIYWDATRPRHAMSCVDCQAQTTSLSSRMRMPFTGLSKYIDSSEYEKASAFSKSLGPENLINSKFEDWEIGEWVKSSVHSHFRASELDFTNSRVIEVYADYIESGILAAYGLSRLIAEFKPSIIFLFNGRQSTTRVALEIAKLNNITRFMHERGAVYDTIGIWKDLPLNSTLVRHYKSLWKSWKNKPLDKNEINTIEDFLQKLQNGKGINWKSFVTARRIGGKRIKNLFKIKSNQKIWSLFTSSRDEIASDECKEIFTNQSDWIERTINIAIKNNQPLLIRIHPNVASKVSTGVNEGELKSLIDLEKKYYKYRDLIYFIASDSDINTYDLIEITDVGITYGSTIGLEMACIGKSVVVCSEASYDHLENIWTVKNKDQYEDLHLLSARVNSKYSIKKEALRYAYYYYYVALSTKFPYVKMTDPHNAVLNYNSLEDLLPGKEEYLDRICDYILHNKEIINVPNISDEELEKNKIIEAEHIQNSFVKKYI